MLPCSIHDILYYSVLSFCLTNEVVTFVKIMKIRVCNTSEEVHTTSK